MSSEWTAGRPVRGWLRRSHVVAVVVALGLPLTSACGDDAAPAAGAAPAAQQDGGGSGSRAQLYGSLAELADASALVVTGTVRGQRVVADLPDTDLQFTLADVVVDEVLRGDVAPGAGVVVRQTPTTDAQALQEGVPHLLYLTPSGLGGELGSHYFVTGVTAGIYTTDAAGSAGATWRRFDVDSGDALPAEVRAADALG